MHHLILVLTLVLLGTATTAQDVELELVPVGRCFRID